jgi:outer membrane translocation and assembly module TamA
VPALYRNRSTVAARVRFAVTPRLSVSGGVSVAELDPLDEDPLTDEPLADVAPSRVANAFVGGIAFAESWRTDSGPDHDLDAVFTLRAGSEALESDFTYERYAGAADYQVHWDDHRMLLSGMAGGVHGDAPLFERFALGDSRTLRGWDKYDIAPVGADRVVHLSAEYRYRGLALFLDSGSVWDAGADRRFRVSTGVGFHTGPLFFTVGVPLNSDELRAVFTMGFRAKGWGAQVR